MDIWTLAFSCSRITSRQTWTISCTEGYQQDPISQTHSEFNESFIQQAGQIPFALGSPVVLHSHLSLDIPTKYYGSFVHLQPQGQFDSMQVHESVDVQQAGHYPFPAHGSPVDRHQHGQVIESVSQTQTSVSSRYDQQQTGHSSLPALVSLVFQLVQLAEGWLIKSDVKKKLMLSDAVFPRFLARTPVTRNLAITVINEITQLEDEGTINTFLPVEESVQLANRIARSRQFFVGGSVSELRELANSNPKAYEELTKIN
ncbi:MAG: hypothetical protein EZS28_048476, partial [Streblomastix strix]